MLYEPQSGVIAVRHVVTAAALCTITNPSHDGQGSRWHAWCGRSNGRIRGMPRTGQLASETQHVVTHESRLLSRTSNAVAMILTLPPLTEGEGLLWGESDRAFVIRCFTIWCARAERDQGNWAPVSKCSVLTLTHGAKVIKVSSTCLRALPNGLS